LTSGLASWNKQPLISTLAFAKLISVFSSAIGESGCRNDDSDKYILNLQSVKSETTVTFVIFQTIVYCMFKTFINYL